MYKQITPQELKSLRSALHYDPETGNFSRKEDTNYGRHGDKCGTISEKGYLKIKLNNRSYKAHRLAWIFMFGVNPEYQIDHINGNKLDNRIANLRDVTQRINLQNVKNPGLRNTTGYLGVSFDKRRNMFFASISVGFGTQSRVTKQKRFTDAANAYVWYVEQKRLLHPGNML